MNNPLPGQNGKMRPKTWLRATVYKRKCFLNMLKHGRSLYIHLLNRNSNRCLTGKNLIFSLKKKEKFPFFKNNNPRKSLLNINNMCVIFLTFWSIHKVNHFLTADACLMVRGNPSSRNPLAHSGLSRFLSIISMTRSSLTNWPWSITPLTLFPSSDPEAMTARSMSPVSRDQNEMS